MKNILVTIALLATTTSLYAQSLAPALQDAVDNGDGSYTNWFGTFTPTDGTLRNTGGISHEEHGDLWISAMGNGLWIYDPNVKALGAGINGWIYTSKFFFPYFYVRTGNGSWFIYISGVEGPGGTPRVFYNTIAKENLFLSKSTTDTIVGVASGNEAFSSLVTAVVAADLVDALSSPGSFTVFAPVDDAFAALDPNVLNDLLTNPESKSALTDILTYHVVPGRIPSGELGLNLGSILRGEYISGYVETLNGADLRIDTTPFGVMINGTSMVVLPDVEASNGIIHVIDEVLLPPADIVDTAIGNPDFSTLVEAVVKAGLVDALRGTDPELTVFAPTNAAFDAAAKALLENPEATGSELVEALDVETLTAVLLYQVVGAAVYSSEVAEGPVPTLGGASATISIGETGLMIDGANIIATDVAASNGVIHVIDQVILPPTE
jgi:transforming growth factor-beta-induced protein